MEVDRLLRQPVCSAGAAGTEFAPVVPIGVAGKSGDWLEQQLMEVKFCWGGVQEENLSVEGEERDHIYKDFSPLNLWPFPKEYNLF